MSVRSFQTILDANNARKAALRTKLLGILDSGRSPDGVPLAYGSCSYRSERGTCIVGAVLDPAVRTRLGENRWHNTKLVHNLCLDGELDEQSLGGLTLDEARLLQGIFDDQPDAPDAAAELRRAIDRMFPEAA